MYNKTEIKKWIKNAAKKTLLFDGELISDNYIVLQVTPEINQCITECFLTLNNINIKDGVSLDTMPNLKNYIKNALDDIKPLTVTSYYKHFTVNEKEFFCNVLMGNSEETYIDNKYYNLFDRKEKSEFTKCQLQQKGNGKVNPVIVTKYDEFVGLILPCRDNSIAMYKVTAA